MNHFSSADWIDFTRRLLPGGKAERMQEHLDAGCEECRKSFSFWQLVTHTASREQAYEPPRESIEEVTAAYRAFRPVKHLFEKVQWARLLFDSFLQPSLATVRAATQTTRQLIHESEPFTIDVRLEPDTTRKRIYLTGQVINSKNPGEIADGVDVVLLKDSEQIRKTETTASGEFDLDFSASDNLELFLNIRGQRAIAIKLPDLVS